MSIRFFWRFWYFYDRNSFISLQEISKTDTFMFYGSFSLMILSFLMISDISAWIWSTSQGLSSISILRVN